MLSLRSRLVLVVAGTLVAGLAPWFLILGKADQSRSAFPQLDQQSRALEGLTRSQMCLTGYRHAVQHLVATLSADGAHVPGGSSADVRALARDEAQTVHQLKALVELDDSLAVTDQAVTAYFGAIDEALESARDGTAAQLAATLRAIDARYGSPLLERLQGAAMNRLDAIAQLRGSLDDTTRTWRETALATVAGAGLAGLLLIGWVIWAVARPMGALGRMAQALRAGEALPAGPVRFELEFEAIAETMRAFATGAASARSRLGEDPVTGLPTVERFEERLGEFLARVRTSGQPGALYVLQIEGLAEIGAAAGRASANLCLRELTLRLKTAQLGEVFRFHGNRFVILGRLAMGREAAEAEAARNAAHLSSLANVPVRIDRTVVPFTPSVGYALAPFDAEADDLLMVAAESGLREAQEGGANEVRRGQVSTPSAIVKGYRDSHALREALRTDGLMPYFQPIVDLRTCKVVSVEALARWSGEQAHNASAKAIVGTAERVGSLRELTECLLPLACAAVNRWQREGERVSLSFNIPPRLLDRDLAPLVRESLASSGLPPELLALEVTESQRLTDVDQAVRALAPLRQMGVSICLDDFGTQYSILSLIEHLSVRRIKIDQSFVKLLLTDPAALRWPRAIVMMAEALGIDVVAEGVQTPLQMRALLEARCHVHQGFLYAPALPEHEAQQWIRSAPGRLRRLLDDPPRLVEVRGVKLPG